MPSAQAGAGRSGWRDAAGDFLGWHWRRVRDFLRRECEREYAQGGLFNFVPILLGLGVAVYFLLPDEPGKTALLASAMLPALFAFRRTRHDAAWILALAISLFFCGMLLAQWRCMRVDGPVLEKPISGQVTGLVIDRDRNASGSPRYWIRPTQMEGIAPGQLPARIRLSAASPHEALAPGEAISGMARISPLSGPAYPGGYDFAFQYWFRGIGGTGYFSDPPRPAARIAPGLRESLVIAVNRVRLAIAARIERHLDARQGAIAIALITGDRSGIDGATQESLRLSGLAHILSISGLHMALIAMTVMWLVRFGLTFSSYLTLHHATRKWAAAAALLVSSLYLILSGAAVPTQRSYVMVAFMLLALLADRNALTMRNVALAAIIVLALAPESLFDPGFQMSFAATAAIIAVHGVWQRHSRQWAAEGGTGISRLLAGVGRLAAPMLLTSLAAGVATGLYSAWHFHRVAPLGLIANLAAMPVVSFAVMPLALGSVLFMPYGAEALPLHLLGPAIEFVCAISDAVSAIPLHGHTGTLPLSFLLLGSLALLLLTLLRSRLRLAGLIPLAMLPLLARPEAVPGMLISQDGDAIALRDRSDRLALLYPRRGRFASRIWLIAWSNGMAGDRASLTDKCDPEHCLAVTPEGLRVEIIARPEQIEAACAAADILVAPRLYWVRCQGRWPRLILNRWDLERSGSHLLHFKRKGDDVAIEVQTARGNGRRPWGRASGASVQIF